MDRNSPGSSNSCATTQTVVEGQLPGAVVRFRARALHGEQCAYRDVVPFAKTLVEAFPDRALWGTDWPHPNLKDHMPDDGFLVDFIPHIAVTAQSQYKLLVKTRCGSTGRKRCAELSPQCTVSKRYSSPSSPSDMMV